MGITSNRRNSGTLSFLAVECTTSNLSYFRQLCQPFCLLDRQANLDCSRRPF